MRSCVLKILDFTDLMNLDSHLENLGMLNESWLFSYCLVSVVYVLCDYLDLSSSIYMGKMHKNATKFVLVPI